MKEDLRKWDKREWVACGPGDNPSHARARRLAKKRGNRRTRRTKKSLDTSDQSE